MPLRPFVVALNEQIVIPIALYISPGILDPSRIMKYTAKRVLTKKLLSKYNAHFVPIPVPASRNQALSGQHGTDFTPRPLIRAPESNGRTRSTPSSSSAEMAKKGEVVHTAHPSTDILQTFPTSLSSDDTPSKRFRAGGLFRLASKASTYFRSRTPSTEPDGHTRHKSSLSLSSWRSRGRSNTLEHTEASSSHPNPTRVIADRPEPAKPVRPNLKKRPSTSPMPTPKAPNPSLRPTTSGASPPPVPYLPKTLDGIPLDRPFNLRNVPNTRRTPTPTPSAVLPFGAKSLAALAPPVELTTRSASDPIRPRPKLISRPSTGPVSAKTPFTLRPPEEHVRSPSAPVRVDQRAADVKPLKGCLKRPGTAQ